MKYHMNTPNRCVTVFDSVGDLIDQAFCCHDEEQFASRCNPIQTHDGDLREFCVKQANRLEHRHTWVMGVKNRKTTMDLFDNPPDWMIGKAHSCLDQIDTAVANQNEAAAPRRKRRLGLEDGDTLMLDRVMTRHPEPWERMERPDVSHKVVRILVNCATDWKQDKEILVYRGAAAVASAMQIEQRGGKCEIWATFCSSSCRYAYGVKNFDQITLVKPCNEPTTVTRTLATVAHLGFFRCVMLNASQNSAQSSPHEDHNYGIPARISGPVQTYVKPDVTIDYTDVTLTAACAAVSRSIEAADTA